MRKKENMMLKVWHKLMSLLTTYAFLYGLLILLIVLGSNWSTIVSVLAAVKFQDVAYIITESINFIS